MRLLRKTVCSLHVWLVLAGGLASASLALAQGTVAYFQPGEPVWDVTKRDAHVVCHEY